MSSMFDALEPDEAPLMYGMCVCMRCVQRKRREHEEKVAQEKARRDLALSALEDDKAERKVCTWYKAARVDCGVGVSMSV